METFITTSKKMLMKLFLAGAVLFCTACATEEIEESGISDTPQTALKAPTNSSSTLDYDTNYYIKNVSTGKFLDLQNYGNGGVTNVHQWEFHGGTNQQWHVKKGAKNGQYKFISVAKSDKCLEITNGSKDSRANVGVGTRVSGSKKQEFRVGGWANNQRSILNVKSNKRVCADLQSRNVHQWTKLEAGHKYLKSQAWIFYQVTKN